VYIPVVFYATRWIVVGITELFAVVDRAVVRGSIGAKQWVKEPDVHSALISGNLGVEKRNDIGLGVLWIVIILVGFAYLLV
jgi:multicomponent Na+:H+ antiporter subunit D